LAHPAGHSLSPVIQRAALDDLGLKDWTYEAFDVPPGRLLDALQGLFALGFKGVNLSVPHKEAVIPYLKGLSPEAAFIGSVNTLVRQDDGYFGHNTDARGFLASLEEDANFNPQGAKVLVLGAGGAARAVVVALARAGAAAIWVLNRTPARALALAALAGQVNAAVNARALALNEPGLEQIVGSVDLLVQTTSVGLDPNSSALPLIRGEWLVPGQLLYELIYRPYPTPLARQAAARGLKTCGGLGMLLRQGALSLELWSGRKPSLEAMKQAALKALAPENEVAW